MTYTMGLLPILVLLISVSGVAYYGNLVWTPRSLDISHPTIAAIDQSSAQLATANYVGLTHSVPTRLKASTVKINAPIMTVGLKPDQTLETPPLFENITGWYENSPTPGEIGPAIIVGHVDSVDGPSVFYRLRELAPGDLIEITREDGTVAEFAVDALAQYEQADFPTDKVFGNTDEPTLRLITCGGIFDSSTGRYSHNTVVYASLR